MAANTNALKATIERYRKEVDALRGQLKAGQRSLTEQRRWAVGWEHLYRQEKKIRIETYLELSALQRRIDNAQFKLRLRYLFTGRL